MVVPACVQALLYVAVQLVHHSLHVRVLVLEHKDNRSEAWLKHSETPGVGNGLLQQLRALAVDRGSLTERGRALGSGGKTGRLQTKPAVTAR